MNIDQWISIGQFALTALSVSGAGLAWFFANASRKSRNQAAENERKARLHLEAVQGLHAEAGKIADAVSGPQFTLELKGGPIWVLRNRTDRQVTFKRLNGPVTPVTRLIEFPIVLRPGGSVELKLSQLGGYPLPNELFLVDGGGREVVVFLGPGR